MKLVLIIAMGILLAGVIGYISSIVFFGAALKGASDTIAVFSNKLEQAKVQTPTSQKLASGTIDPVNAMYGRNLRITTQVMADMNQSMLENTKEYQIRKFSKQALEQAQRETEPFDRIYQKPPECLENMDRATKIKCGNHYMRARKLYIASKVQATN